MVELGPVITASGAQSTGGQPIPEDDSVKEVERVEKKPLPLDGEEMTSRGVTVDATPENDKEEDHHPLREASLSERPISTPPSPNPIRSRDGVDSGNEKRSSDQKNSNAMLNLPPPLPFDLKVSNLWVGVPHRGPTR
jgi:hypothetical protein